MFLLIDWGNSYLKTIAVSQLNAEALQTAAIGRGLQIDELPELLENVEKVLIASVRNQQDNALLEQLLAARKVPYWFAKTNPKACDVECAYADYKKLGIDRWLVVLAAALESEQVGVIDIGSAITLDIVAKKKHLGGHILPGKKLMLDSLFATGQVRPNLNFSSLVKSKLGQSTSDCVNYAMDTAINSYLKAMLYHCEKEYGVKTWLVTGGGAEQLVINQNSILETKHHRLKWRPKLVFEGLLSLYLDNSI